MMLKNFLIALSFFLMLGCTSSLKKSLQYLAQQPPSTHPEVFAPGLISKTDEYEFSAVFNKKGSECFFSRVVNGKEKILYTKLEGGSWMEPVQLLESLAYEHNVPFLSPDENRLYFISRSAMDGKSDPKDYDIWFLERQPDGWSTPIHGGKEINSDRNEYNMSLTDAGNMFFVSNREDKFDFNIYQSDFSNGSFQKPTPLSNAVNSYFYEEGVFVDPNEAYIIFSSTRVGSYGKGDLYISFKEEDGSWGQARNMGAKINSKETETTPFVTKDGKYLFYTSNKDIYWIDAKLIQEIKNTPIAKLNLTKSYSSIKKTSAKDSLAALRKHILNGKYPNIEGILVAQHDETIIEEYFDRFDRDSLHQIRSSLKPITSLLAGIAVDQNLFSVNDPVGRFLTEWKDDPRGDIKIKDFLEMRSGLACEGFFGRGPDCEAEMAKTDNWLEYYLSVPAKHAPGTKWEYSSLEPDILGVVIARASNMKLEDFAKKYLFEPLEIKEYRWHHTPEGRAYAAGSFYMKPKDLLKVAQLVHHKGVWKGTQIVSKEWIEEATNCEILIDMSFVDVAGVEQAEHHMARYGYYWYREVIDYKDFKTEVLFSFGNAGQAMMILEDYNATITFNGGAEGSWKHLLCFEVLLKYILPILQPS